MSTAPITQPTTTTPTPLPSAAAVTPPAPPAAPPPSARETAEQVLSWARQHNLLEAGAVMAQSADPISPDDGTLFPNAAQAMRLLQRKAIIGVAYSEAERLVHVLTRRKLTDSEQKRMPPFAAGTGLRYLHFGQASTGNDAPPPDSAAYRELNGRYCCGSSIHPAKYNGAGTLGCLVRDAAGQIYGLSANHVTGLANYAHAGEKILAPGHSDITPEGRDPFTVGVHVKALPFVSGTPANVDIHKNSDAAIFAIRQPETVSSSQGGYYDTPARSAAPAGGMAVEKVGRTTGYTSGRIIGISPVPQAIQYTVVAESGKGVSTAYLDGLAIAIGLNGQPFSFFGDSGALVVGQTEVGPAAVGLIVAGTQGGQSLILPIGPILEALEMTLVSQHYA